MLVIQVNFPVFSGATVLILWTPAGSTKCEFFVTSFLRDYWGFSHNLKIRDYLRQAILESG
jgi:hypothetical protein